MIFESGQVFANFKIISKLGEGGMGEVYLAEDMTLGRKVALKILQAEFFDNPDRQERFYREARSAAQISHPNVMAIHSIDKAVEEKSGRELSFIVMEYIEGETLTDYLMTRNPSMKDLIRISAHIANGLAVAHRRNIVHRDIKTDNIIIDREGEPKILDFGLAKPVAPAISEGPDADSQTVSEQLTQEGKILGTVTYMSPEQARGEAVDNRSDIFSLGIMFYKMFAGEYPFEGKDRVSTLAKILEVKQAPIRQKNVSLPPELERIIEKCLQKDPNDRYQDTRDLAVDLRSLRKQYESGISDTDSLMSDIAQVRRSTEKKKGRGFLAYAVPVLILAAVAVLVIFMRSSSNQSTQATTLRLREDALAILVFENKTSDPELDWLSAGLPEILQTDLSQNAQSNLISRSRILSSIENTGGSDPGSADIQKYIAAAKSLGASKVLSGSYIKMGDKIRIDARLEDIETGEIILGEKVIGEDPFILVDSLTMKIAQSLNLQELAEGDEDVTRYTSSSPEAYKQYILGLEEFDKGVFDPALEYFEKAIAIDSTFALPYMRIGMIHVFNRRPQQGMQYFVLALKYEDRLPVKDRSLLDIYADIWLRNKYDDAYAKLTGYVKNYPDDWEGRYFYAVFLYQLGGSTERSLAQLDTLLILNPRDGWSLAQASLINRNLGNYQKALEYSKKLKQYNPESPESYESLSTIYRKMGRYDDAIAECQELLKLKPGDFNTLDILHRISILKRDFNAAERYVEDIKAFYGDDYFKMHFYYADMANLVIWEGKFKKAVDLWHQAIDNAYKTEDSAYIAGCYQSLSVVFQLLKMGDSTVYYGKEADRYSSSFNRFSYAFLLVSTDLKYVDEARPIFNSSMESFKSRLPTETWDLADNLGAYFEAFCTADTAAMISSLEKIVERPGQNENSNIFELGVICALNGQYDKALEHLTRVISGDLQTTTAMSYLRALYYRGIAYQGLGKYQEAKQDFQEVLKYWSDPDVEIKEIRGTHERLAELPA